MEFVSPEAAERYRALVATAATTAVGLDMDGTLSPIVDDPAQAFIHPQAREVLGELGRAVLSIAIITGRPARQAVALGDLDAIGNDLAVHGRSLSVFGQYGNERWSSVDRRVVAPRPPHGLASFLAGVPAVLRKAGVPDTFVEEKGLGVALHTRRLADPGTAIGRLEEPVRALATRHGLTLEPGRNVLEVRAPGVHKGDAVRTFAAETGAGGFLFAGDDLGDLEAYAAVRKLRADGMPTLLVCSTSSEQSALRAEADLCVAGPDGVMAFLRRLAADAADVPRKH